MRMGMKAIGLLVSGAIIVGCFGGGSDFFGNPEPQIYGFFPCSALPGDEVTIAGANFNAPGAAPAVFFDGTPVNTIVSRSATRITVIVPTGGGDGPIRVSNSAGHDDSALAFTYGGGTVVEVEPNDNIDGTNATPVPKSGKAAGSLSSVADKDHFLIECMDVDGTYIVKVSPVISPIYINGAPYNPNASGEVSINPSATSILVGLTGATGPYTLTARLAP